MGSEDISLDCTFRDRSSYIMSLMTSVLPLILIFVSIFVYL
jgi:hypothetical protein